MPLEPVPNAHKLRELRSVHLEDRINHYGGQINTSAITSVAFATDIMALEKKVADKKAEQARHIQEYTRLLEIKRMCQDAMKYKEKQRERRW